MGHFLSDTTHKLGVWCGILFSFVEQNIALLSFALGVVGYLTRLYFDKKESTRRDILLQAQLDKLNERS